MLPRTECTTYQLLSVGCRPRCRYAGLWRTQVLDVEITGRPKPVFGEAPEGSGGGVLGGRFSTMRLAKFLVGDPGGARTEMTLPYDSRWGLVWVGWKPACECEALLLGRVSCHLSCNIRWGLSPRASCLVPSPVHTAAGAALTPALAPLPRLVPPLRYELVCEGEPAELLVLSDSPEFESFRAVKDVYLPANGFWLSEYPYADRTSFLEVCAAGGGGWGVCWLAGVSGWPRLG